MLPLLRRRLIGSRARCRGGWVMVGKCQATTRDGAPCSAQARPGSAFCPWHDPALAQRRSEWSARGGVGRSNKARARKLAGEPLTAGELHALLCDVLRRVVAGDLDKGIGTAAASLARATAEVGILAELSGQ